MDQVLKGVSSTISLTFYVGETATALTSPTVAIVDDADNVIQASTTPTTVSTGVYSFVLTPTMTSECDILTATWGGTISSVAQAATTKVEVVGGFMFTLPELRAMPDLSNTSTYTTAELVKARDWITALIERECRTSFVERYRTQIVDRVRWTGSHKTRGIVLGVADDYPISLRSVHLDGTALTSDELATLEPLAGGVFGTKYGEANPLSGAWDTAVVRYTAGYSLEPPQDLKDAALVAARWRLLSQVGSSAIPSRATSIDQGGSTIRLSTPGSDWFVTGIAEVDEAIVAYRKQLRIPGIA